MPNLKKETIDKLIKNGKSASSIVWIGCKDFQIDIDEFWKLADQEYDNGYGGQEVAEDLLVVGEDWWLERHEYDGSEWWEFKTIPQKPDEIKSVERVMSPHVGWHTLYGLNFDDFEEE